MKKILLLVSILMYCITSYAQPSLKATPITFVSGNSVTFTPFIPENITNNIYNLAFGLEPGAATILNMNIVSSSFYNTATQAGTQVVINFSFRYPAAATQPLTFAVPYTVYYTNSLTGVQNQFSTFIQLTINPQVTTYWNVAKSQTFYNNTCSAGQAAEPYNASVAAHTYSSTISQADADSKATAWIAANGQNAANANSPCKTIYYNSILTQSFAPVCSTGYQYSGPSIAYTVPANKYTSLISQADADAKAQNEMNTNGQSAANAQCIQDISLVLDEICTTFGSTASASITGVPSGVTVTWSVNARLQIVGSTTGTSILVQYDPNGGTSGPMRVTATLSNGVTRGKIFRVSNNCN